MTGTFRAMRPVRAEMMAAWAAACLAIVCAGDVAAQPPATEQNPPAMLQSIDRKALAQAGALRERALADDGAYQLIASLTREVGPRLAGSENDPRAVAWALATLKAAGFRNVHAEPVTVPRWERGELSVEIVAPSPQRLVAVSLGGSTGTGGQPLEAQVLAVTSIAELKQLTRAQVAGRFVYFGARMTRVPDLSSYHRVVTARSDGAIEAVKLGAIGVLVRSAGTSNGRLAHTGRMHYADSLVRIPGVALSNPDADQLEEQLASGAPVRVRIRSTAHDAGTAQSANVVGELPGRGARPDLVVLGAHLDSWDLGTGAQDDGAGIALMVRSAELIAALPQRPLRTLRVVLFANEESGLSGAVQYAKDHATEVDRIAVALEADLGSGRVRGLASNVPIDRLALPWTMATVLMPLGIRYTDNLAEGGSDIGKLHELGVPMLQLEHDASDYFDIHHTADDVLAAVDPLALRQALAAYVAVIDLAAEAPQGFGRTPVAPVAAH